MQPHEIANWLIGPHRPTLVMGVLNVTPDSFSDGGKFAQRDAALAHVRRMVDEGADWIDVGAESTRPGSQRVSAAEQLDRLRPVLAELRKLVPVVLSIDTTLAEVASVALDSGVDVVNDISAGRDDADLLPLVARRGVPIILMHMRGEPANMQIGPQYSDVTAEVIQFLCGRREVAEAAGVAREKILFDPGIGFGKTVEHNLQLLRDLPKLAALGQPVVVGTSRKRFISKITGETTENGAPWGTAATVAWSAANGASIVRVHDIAATMPVVKMVRTIRETGNFQ